MEKVLVSGGAGFIGSHIVDLLVKEGYEPIIIDNLSTGTTSNLLSNLKFYHVDITSPDLEMIFEKEKPSYVIHLAAQVDVEKSIKNPSRDAEINILGTIRLLTYCYQFNIKKIIFSSSCAVYGNTPHYGITELFPVQPLSFYAISKYASEMYIKLFYDLYGLPFTILRYANVYGPRQNSKGEGGVVSIFLNKLFKNEDVNIYGDGEQTRDFVYVKDVAAANLLSLKKGDNEIINIGLNSKTSINKLYHLCKTMITNPPVYPIYLPARKGDIKHSALDHTKAIEILGWKPKYDLLQGLSETIKIFDAENQGLN
ncbi:NAD-dependent epimerase/dehydratase family protein [Bacillus sp. JJ1532]|uniref:NAD-dependent epimerase/dehydratase family protein n=1 Tax=unclassified Bacillus (in: firmicutes) TaxID=185979 RepID=UPI002FFEE2A8